MFNPIGIVNRIINDFSKSPETLAIYAGLTQIYLGGFILYKSEIFKKMPASNLHEVKNTEPNHLSSRIIVPVDKKSKLKLAAGIVNIIMGISLLGWAGYSLYSRSSSLTTSSQENHRFLPPLKPQLHYLENEAERIFGKEILSLSPKDLRPKALYLVGPDHGSNAFDLEVKVPGTDIVTGTKDFLETLDRTHDVIYKVIYSPKEICSAISEASKIEAPKTLLINAHGSPESITFLKGHISMSENTLFGLSENCFSKLAPEAEITLLSCETGNTSNGIASQIAKFAQRIVWAPTESMRSDEITLSAGEPSIPTFYSLDKNKDCTCKFFPDGSSSCSIFFSKVIPGITKLAKSLF